MAAWPEIVAELSRRWSLRVGRPFQPGGCASWVAPARAQTGAEVVLKVGWRHPEAEHEAQGLRAWRGEGTVRLLDALLFGDTSALLLEACEPGTAMSEVLPPREQDVVIAGLLRRVWIKPQPGHPFRPLATMRSVGRRVRTRVRGERAATAAGPGGRATGNRPVPGPSAHC